MVKPIRKNPNKNPPIFSHEFVIQNHADIVSCVAMLLVAGLMIQVTSPIASVLIVLQHNITAAGETALYIPGRYDLGAVFFYSLATIIFHALFQEYILDKISKRLHLSKSKLAIFSTSGQLAAFYIVSIIWGIDIIYREGYLFDISLLWSNYPAPMSFLLKLFLIFQMAYSLHELPELYFQRVKKEEHAKKALGSLARLLLVAVPYYLNFNRLLVCLLVLHHISDLVLHASQLVQTVDKDERFTKASRYVSNVFLVLSRLGSIILAVLTLWYGLALGEERPFNYSEGYYNIPPIRLAILGGILILQVYLTFTIISQELKRTRESRSFVTIAKVRSSQKKDKPKKSKKPQADESDLPEVDQNTNKNLRNRAQKAK